LDDVKQDPDRPQRFLFPRWTNRLRELLALLAIGGLVYLAVIIGIVFGPGHSAVGYAPEQPVPYSHAVHAGELGLDCRYCHNTVERRAAAALPAAETCMNCHRSVKTDSEALAPIRDSYERGTPVPWVRVHDLPDFAYFDHSAHLSAGVGCVECHGRVDRMEVVRQDKPLTMGWCLECHRAPDARLRPREYVTDLDWVPDEDPVELGKRLRTELQVAPSTDCSICHR
jgi:hypothetical protein